jgi:WD40 repeat protein
LTGGSDGTVRLWNAKTGAELKALAGHAKDVRAVAFSSDGAMAYSAGDDLKLLQWDLDKGTIVKKIDLPQRTWEMQFAPSGKYLIIGIDGAANQINMTTGRTVRKINLFTKSITAFAISPDERTIAAADIQCNVSLWNLDTEKSRSLRSLPRGPEPANGITSLAFSPDGHWLVSGAMGAEKTASLWDLKTDAEVHRVGPFPGFVRDAIFAADSKSFYVASGLTGLQPKKKLAALVNCSITQFDTETGQPTQFWDQFPHLPLHLFRGGEARQMIVVVHDKLIRQSTENGKSISAP